MSAKIRVEWSKGSLIATLNDTPTTQALLAALPFSGSANTWGDEVYFSIPVQAKLEKDAKQVVDPGTVCYWVPGSALALPFGPTPISEGAMPKLASPCNVLGKFEGDAKTLNSVRDGDTIKVSLVE
ncbi:MAG TPA: cyclophilin-like fold protein [Burkholderiales bacterium]|jgi:uncharacterized protein|nr:cyclophilin-like fold protein [Burkholderiales bacterium]